MPDSTGQSKARQNNSSMVSWDLSDIDCSQPKQWCQPSVGAISEGSLASPIGDSHQTEPQSWERPTCSIWVQLQKSRKKPEAFCGQFSVRSWDRDLVLTPICWTSHGGEDDEECCRSPHWTHASLKPQSLIASSRDAKGIVWSPYLGKYALLCKDMQMSNHLSSFLSHLIQIITLTQNSKNMCVYFHRFLFARKYRPLSSGFKLLAYNDYWAIYRCISRWNQIVLQLLVDVF